MAWFDTGWGLAAIVSLPLLGAVVVLLSQPKSEDLIKGVAFVTALSTFMLSVVAARRLSPEPGQEIIVEPFLGGIPGLADRYYVASFGIRLPIVVLFGFLATLLVIYSYKQWRRPSHAKAIVMVTLLAMDFLVFEVIFEAGTPPAAAGVASAILVPRWSGAFRHVSGDSASQPSRDPVAGSSNVFEEEMSGLVR